jgi:pimeloyl-ACP methyl ester carboxylesterase
MDRLRATTPVPAISFEESATVDFLELLSLKGREPGVRPHVQFGNRVWQSNGSHVSSVVEQRSAAKSFDFDKDGAMEPVETELTVGDRVLRIRDSGDAHAPAILYFHGTPGSRLDLRFGEDILSRQGVRIISFDRPGYGGSTEAAFGLTSVARDALSIADSLGLGAFATLGQSGGGPFALAAAAAGGGRITGVGVASGAGPFEYVPNALEQLSDIDKEAYSHLPADPEAAALGFASGFEELAQMLRSGEDEAVIADFAPALSERDRVLMSDEAIGSIVIGSMREGLSKSVLGGAWDNVAWIGHWDFEISHVRCPVLLWYGEQDLMAPPAHGQWLKENLINATLTIRPSEGHFGLVDHFSEVLRELAEL